MRFPHPMRCPFYFQEYFSLFYYIHLLILFTGVSSMKSRLKKYRILMVSVFLLVLFFGLRSLLMFSFGKAGHKTFEAFCNRLFVDEVTANTMNLHFTLKDPKAAGIDSYEVTLGNISGNMPKNAAKELHSLQKQLDNYSYRSLNNEEKLTYRLLLDYISREKALTDFPYYEELLSPSGGITSQLPVLLAEYPFYSKQDIADYLALLTQMDSYFAGILEYEEEKAKKGLFMSDDACMKVIDGCEIFTEHPDDNFLVTTFAGRLEDVEGLTDAEKQNYISSNKTAIAEHVVPAYQQMIAGLTRLLGKGRNDWGLCNYKDGMAYYEALTAYNTGCDDGVQSLFRQIETARKEDLSVCADILSENPGLATESIDLGENFCDENKMLTVLQSAILTAFPKPPESDCTICHVDPALSEYLAPAFYITAPIDSYRDNKIYINDACNYADIYYFTTLAHEGYPGHLYQTIQTYSYDPAPIRTLLDYPGYTEGWATYVEMQAFYYASLPDDLAILLQHNQAATLSLYATSDIGIHYYGWEKADLKKFWGDYGVTDEETVEAITDLIMEEPANYLKYYVGYLKFRQLRKTYEKKYGDSFDAKAFHEAILRTGPAPFAILEKEVAEQYHNN